MQVLYEETGDLKVGSVLTESPASLHVEAPHGKRSKIKSTHVLLRFRDEALSDFLARADTLARDIDTAFLWECCGEAEFGFESLAHDYFGRAPAPIEAAAILLKLHSAPIYFHRKGKGRFRAAPADVLKAALAGLEKKRQQQLAIDGWEAQLTAFELPAAFRPLLDELLYKPDRNRIETRALEQACARTGLSAAHLLDRCGALPSPHDYHLGRFLFEHFPRGDHHEAVEVPEPPRDLPLAEVAAFSLDDAATTEIDDAFSVQETPGSVRVGIHIAAPGLGIAPGSQLDRIARARLSTIYTPGRKITMLPPQVIARYTLDAGNVRPALSLYFDLDPVSFEIRSHDTRLELVPIAANLRHQDIDHLNETLERGEIDADVPFGTQIALLNRFAIAREAARGKTEATSTRKEYSFYVENGRVAIVARKRGAPLDRLVSELMILTNSTWGRLLDEHDIAGVYRTQGAGGKVRMSTVAGEHQGLGVSHYAWSSSPLRRYVDLVNQWGIIALLRREAPPFTATSEALLTALRDFEAAYAVYDELQRQMEHYWCLQWLVQERVSTAPAEVVREGLVRFRDLPLTVRVPSLPDLPSGAEVTVEIAAIDLIDSLVRCVYKRPQAIPEVA